MNLKTRFIRWIDQTLKEIKKARLIYYHWLIKEAKKGTKFSKWQPK